MVMVVQRFRVALVAGHREAARVHPRPGAAPRGAGDADAPAARSVVTAGRRDGRRCRRLSVRRRSRRDRLTRSARRRRGVEPCNTGRTTRRRSPRPAGEPEESMNSYGHFCRPAMVPLLEALGLDATYVMAEGDYLYYRRGAALVRVLDMLGGYGAQPVRPPPPGAGRGGAAPAGRQGADQRAGVVPGRRRTPGRATVPARRRLCGDVHQLRHRDDRSGHQARRTSSAAGRCSGRSRAASTARRSARFSSPGPTGSRTTRWARGCAFSTRSIRRTSMPPARMPTTWPRCWSNRLPARAVSRRCRRRLRPVSATSAPGTTSRSSPTRSRPAWGGPARSSRPTRWASSPTTSASASRSVEGWRRLAPCSSSAAGSSTSSRCTTPPPSPRTTSAAALR